MSEKVTVTVMEVQDFLGKCGADNDLVSRFDAFVNKANNALDEERKFYYVVKPLIRLALKRLYDLDIACMEQEDIAAFEETTALLERISSVFHKPSEDQAK